MEITPTLLVDDIHLSFGGVSALSGVSFRVDPGVICGLIGPNGAGKTSLFNCVSRTYQPDRGRIEFEGRSVLGLRPHEIAGQGIARTFQNLGMFESLSVRENVLVGYHSRRSDSYVRALVRGPSLRREEARAEEHVEEVAATCQLENVLDEPVADQPYGTLKRVELARALTAQPRLLLLDEPASGLTQGEVAELVDLLLKLRSRFDLTMLLVEHHMAMVMAVSDRVVALDAGRIIADGPPQEVKRDPAVVEAYFGGTPA